MAAPIRTWIEKKADEGAEPTRWDMLMDGAPVDGAFIEKIADGQYDLHFPRLRPTTAESLPMAKRILELAPLPKTAGVRIARAAKETDRAAFVTADEAASELGVARGRINAMVANGVLSAKREGGELLISVKSLRSHAESDNEGPQGVFADKFVQYYPDQDAEEFYLAEVDASDDDAVAEAESFVSFVRDSEQNPGGARLVNFRTAAKLKKQAGWKPLHEGGDVEAFDWDAFVAISEAAERAKAEAAEKAAVEQGEAGEGAPTEGAAAAPAAQDAALAAGAMAAPDAQGLPKETAAPAETVSAAFDNVAVRA